VESFTATRRFASAVISAALLTASGCSPEPPAPVTDEPPTVPADDLPSTTVRPSSKPASNKDPGNMTSYEVAIAIAAANRRKAEAACDTQPAAEREACLAAIAAEWNTTRTALDDLRGEQQ
jgi:acyl-CoA reductase-like NAD-dependent aldehyde dehydrogenase